MLILLWATVASNAALYLGLTWHTVRFLRSVQSIETPDDLMKYRAFATLQMYGALGMLVLIPAYVFFLAMSGLEGIDVWLPLVPALAMGILARPVNRLLKKSQTLPSAVELRSQYEKITEIWRAKALPRFPPVGLGAAASEQGQADCETHGPGSAASACSRCGNYTCNACVTAGAFGPSRCASCRTRFEEIRKNGWPRERAIRIAGVLLIALGIPAVILGLDPAEALVGIVPAAVSWMLLFWGVLCSVGGYLMQSLSPLGRKLGFAAALSQLLAPPTGTVCSLFALYVLSDLGLRDRPHPLTNVYAEAVSLTDSGGYLYAVIGVAPAFILIPMHIGVIEQMLIGFMLGLAGHSPF